MIGDKRKYLTVLITLQCRVAGDSGGKEGELIGESLKLVKAFPLAEKRKEYEYAL